MTHLIFVCGSRDLDQPIDYILDTYRDGVNTDSIVVLQGGAKGADELAREWANRNGYKVITVEANWSQYGKRAGYLRNAAMLDYILQEKYRLGDSLVVTALAFKSKEVSKGTDMMIKLLVDAGLYVNVKVAV